MGFIVINAFEFDAYVIQFKGLRSIGLRIWIKKTDVPYRFGVKNQNSANNRLLASQVDKKMDVFAGGNSPTFPELIDGFCKRFLKIRSRCTIMQSILKQNDMQFLELIMRV